MIETPKILIIEIRPVQRPLEVLFSKRLSERKIQSSEESA